MVGDIFLIVLLSLIVVGFLIALWESIDPVTLYRRYRYPDYWALYDYAYKLNRDLGSYMYSSSLLIQEELRVSLTKFFNNTSEEAEIEFMNKMYSLRGRNNWRQKIIKQREEEVIHAWEQVRNYAIKHDLKWGLVYDDSD